MADGGLSSVHLLLFSFCLGWLAGVVLAQLQ
jgi:hypothetical protein